MRVILSSAIVHMRQAVARSMFRYCLFLNPLCNAILLGFMYSNQTEQTFTLYAVLGTSLSSFWTIICFSSAADISREKYLGTLPVLFVSPSSFKKIMFGKLLGNSLWGLVAFILNSFFVSLLFGRVLAIRHIFLLILFVLLAILTFVSIGMLMCSAFTLSRSAQLLMNTIEFPFLLLTGMAFPLDILWSPLRYISYLFSPTWIMKGFRLAVYGGTITEMAKVLLILSVLTAINFFLAALAFRKIETKSRVDATLEVY
ncbi:ABC transporter [Streptococcus cuniculi]|uniref:Transport permease protein n=1 Tax=Streptococcus cuniculi TaxID=1432788 RepID=A0A1Q8E614_9STRE|nr:ABC transporter permease [Streptococcus cuniculi]OLF47226.1 ABC transporter [Streptococcus cuniculi]